MDISSQQKPHETEGYQLYLNALESDDLLRAEKAWKALSEEEKAIQHVAFQHVKSESLARFLLDKGDVPEPQYEGHPSILHHCAEGLAPFFADLGYDPLHLDRNGQTPLFFAQGVKNAQFFLDCGDSAVRENTDGSTPLCFAETKEVAMLLLDNGADVDHADKYKSTALFYNDTPSDIFELLLERTQNIEHRDRDDKTALAVKILEYVAGEEKTRDNIDALLRHGAKCEVEDMPIPIVQGIILEDPYGIAIKNEKQAEKAKEKMARVEEMLDLVLQNGANIHAMDDEGRTALHWAGTEYSVSLLLKHGANIEARDFEGNTPLHTVLSPRTAEALLAHGADTEAQNNKNQKPDKYIGTKITEFTEQPDVSVAMIREERALRLRNKMNTTPWAKAARDSEKTPLM